MVQLTIRQKLILQKNRQFIVYLPFQFQGYCYFCEFYFHALRIYFWYHSVRKIYFLLIRIQNYMFENLFAKFLLKTIREQDISKQ